MTKNEFHTFHPGALLRASEIKGESGYKITVGEAKKIGFKYTKVG